MPRQTLKQRPDGRYACKYKGIFFYGKTQSEALAAREAYKRDEARGLTRQSLCPSVAEYAAKWLPTHKAHLTQAPYNTHARILNRFCAMYGDDAMDKITASDIQEFYNTLQGRSQSSINDARDTVKGMFKAALADRVIQFDPCLSATPPKGSKGTHRAITQQERNLIHDTPHRMRAGVLVMLYAGLRRGEALAIDIDRDIDFANKLIHVRQAVRFENNHAVLCDPKTEAGSRDVPLLDILCDELRELHGLLMPDANGGIMSEAAFRRGWNSYITTIETAANGVTKRWYGKRKEDCGKELPPWKNISIRPHDLRHSFCTMLYDYDVDLKTAMKWMGHADQAMTMRIYTHLTDEKEKRAFSSLTNGLNKALSSQNRSQQQKANDQSI